MPSWQPWWRPRSKSSSSSMWVSKAPLQPFHSHAHGPSLIVEGNEATLPVDALACIPTLVLLHQ